MNFEEKRPHRIDTSRIVISEDATVDVLTTQYVREYFRMHNAKPMWTPTPLTREWLVDQLEALDWYLPYDTSVEKAFDKNPIPQKSKRKSKEDNPFK